MHAGLKRQDADADKISQKRLDCTIAAFICRCGALQLCNCVCICLKVSKQDRPISKFS